jgi:hypothetical protein
MFPSLQVTWTCVNMLLQLKEKIIETTSSVSRRGVNLDYLHELLQP